MWHVSPCCSEFVTAESAQLGEVTEVHRAMVGSAVMASEGSSW